MDASVGDINACHLKTKPRGDLRSCPAQDCCDVRPSVPAGVLQHAADKSQNEHSRPHVLRCLMTKASRTH